LKKTNDTKNQIAIIQINTSSDKIAKTIHRSLIPEIQTSNLKELRVQVKRIENLLIFHFKSNNTATLRALINSYLRWVITLKKSINVINLKNSTTISR
jgi:tRNA threonylcarbamoyladenosine modification (KEOPS) complex  Pcc1 subunit